MHHKTQSTDDIILMIAGENSNGGINKVFTETVKSLSCEADFILEEKVSINAHFFLLFLKANQSIKTIKFRALVYKKFLLPFEGESCYIIDYTKRLSEVSYEQLRT